MKPRASHTVHGESSATLLQRAQVGATAVANETVTGLEAVVGTRGHHVGGPGPAKRPFGLERQRERVNA